jgi:glucose-1-phosphatase
MLRFFYFDLGKVLLDFDVAVMCQQMADVAGISPQGVKQAIFNDHLQRQYELGQITGRQFHEAFCRQTGTQSAYEALSLAASDIFQLKTEVTPVVAQLRAAGHRLGILSNTCENHWELCRERFPILTEAFEIFTLSYQVGAMKPDPVIYQAAAERAGVRPQEVFFTDDIAVHVASARAVGFDAVQFLSAEQLAAELRARGVTVQG